MNERVQAGSSVVKSEAVASASSITLNLISKVRGFVENYSHSILYGLPLPPHAMQDIAEMVQECETLEQLLNSKDNDQSQ